MQQQLPPLPKLRPRPGFQSSRSSNSDPRQTIHGSPHKTAEESPPPSRILRTNGHSFASEPEEETTSRLLMKSECKGAGRKKNSGSLVHSIPKFSQVKPNGRLTEVQRVLQSRIISKQQRVQQERQHQFEQQRLKQEQDLHQQQHYLMGSQSHGSALSSRPRNPANSGLRASNLLQNIISLHEQKDSSLVNLAQQPADHKTTNNAPVIEAATAGGAGGTSTVKRRGRKPAKNEICHVVTTTPSDSETRVTAAELPQQRPPPPPPPRPFIPPDLPVLSEVTITPARGPSSLQSRRRMEDLDRALDLRKDRSPSPEVIEIEQDGRQFLQPPPRPMLHPHEYQNARMPPGYVYCAGANVFVHHSTLSNQYAEYGQSPYGPGYTKSAGVTVQPKPVAKRMVQQQPATETMESLQSVMRVRPQRPTRTEPTTIEAFSEDSGGGSSNRGSKRRKGSSSSSSPYSSKEGNNEVSICKFKFTGGARPSLEEKKMLSVDSGGNLRYFSGSGDKTLRGFEHLPPDAISRDGASVVTDRFTALTADKIAKANKRSAAASRSSSNKARSTDGVANEQEEEKGRSASDVIRVFEKLPDHSGDGK